MHSAVLVNGSELANAFKTLRKFIKRKQNVEVVFSFEGDIVTIDAAGMKVKMPAEGSLRGQAYVYWHSLIGVATIAPTDDPVTIRVEAGRLIIGTSSLPCSWRESIAHVIDLPMDAPLSMILGLRMRYSDEQIARSGLVELLWEAEYRRDEIIAQALHLLRPLGVEYADLYELVMEALERINRR